MSVSPSNDLDRRPHSTGYKNPRLFLLYSLFIDYYIPFLCIIVILGWNITCSTRRREGATCGVRGEDEGQSGGRAGDSLCHTTNYDEDSSIHARHNGCTFASYDGHSTCTSTSSSVFYSYDMEVLLMYDIYLSCLTHNLFSMQNQSAPSNDPHALPNPSPYQSNWPPCWCSYELISDVCETYKFWWYLVMFVKKFVSFVLFVRYVMLVIHMWWLCDICDV
jgi:hypothetical protein